jgi:diguanylate cyclase (GGDEF)-like protein
VTADRTTRADYAVLADRLRYLLGLRAAFAAVVLGVGLLSADVVGIPVEVLAGLTLAYLALAVVLEVVSRRFAGASFSAMTVMLLVDGVYLVTAMYATGGTQSPIRFLVYLHLVATSLLASYRTGLKIALWYSMLWFVMLYAQAAALVPAIDVAPGQTVALDGLPVLNVTAFWLFALATSVFSAMNERELRQRRADLEALVGIGARLDDEGDGLRQAGIVLNGLVERYGFVRGLVLGTGDDELVVLGARGVDAEVGSAIPVDPIVIRAWSDRGPVAVRSLGPASAPSLAGLLPGATRIIVAPMLADARPVGVVVLELAGSTFRGIERRVLATVAQVASTAALNLRNATLLRRVRDLAERDALTGVANRHTFQASLATVVHAPQTSKGTVSAVLFLDIDDFKVVNDTLGHAAGDELLVAVTERIRETVRDGDLVARLGGDEFAVLTTDLPDLRRSRAMAERLVRELGMPYQLSSGPITISASIGIASASDAVDGAADMVRNADVAMYIAKAGGKAGFAVFDPGMHQAIRERHELALDLQNAADLEQLELRYQPIVHLETGRFAGVEALVRWRHPERGLIQPASFIEIAEEHGSILSIGRWVLRESCRQAAEWISTSVTPADMFVAVNASAREVREPSFVANVRAALADTGLAPERLFIELTETALLSATPATVATLQELRSLGVRVGIDDFGTGYFSLSHLRQFPVDALKIASEFTQEADEPERSMALAAAIVAMAKSLGIETVAEGIETAGQADRMHDLAATYGQGYFFALPLLPSEIPAAARAIAEQVAEVAAASVIAGEADVAQRPGGRRAHRGQQVARTPRAAAGGAAQAASATSGS